MQMGAIHVTTMLSDLGRTKAPYESEFLVDTGAIDCMAPASALHAAGIAEEGKAVYELANGEVVEFHYGFARVAFMGAETVAQVIFGPEDAEPILGVVALENTGIGVDPVSRTLRRMSAKPLKTKMKINNRSTQGIAK
jgi:clan AA aspartic protease